MKIMYPAIIKQDKSKRYFVSFPDLEEAITEGETLEEALFNAQEALTLTLEARMDEDLELPEASNPRIKHVYWVAPSARIQAALLVRLAKGEHTTAELARSLGTSWPSAQRLEDPHHWPSLKQLEKAANTLGKRLVLCME